MKLNRAIRLRVDSANRLADPIEASRLSRNGRDCRHLMDLWALVGTLVIDPDETYDPRLVNDRLLLGANAKHGARPRAQRRRWVDVWVYENTY
jgi:hypothetical protein